MTHTRLCIVKYLTNRTASPIFSLNKNSKGMLSPPMSYSKRFERASF